MNGKTLPPLLLCRGTPCATTSVSSCFLMVVYSVLCLVSLVCSLVCQLSCDDIDFNVRFKKQVLAHFHPTW